MKALFKEKNTMIINSADSNEQMLLTEFIDLAKEKDVIYTRLLDINGNTCGLCIEISDKEKNVEEIIEENNEEELSE